MTNVLFRFLSRSKLAALCLGVAGIGSPLTALAQETAAAAPNITVTPGGTVIIGAQQQFTAAATGFGAASAAVTWSVSAPAGSNLSPGDISATGLYTTPYPAPATVTITATSVALPAVKGSMTVALSEAPLAAGPALMVDAGNKTHSINPDIYGMNAFAMAKSVGKAVNLPVDRWGGDGTSLYNYKLDVSSAGSDWFYQNSRGHDGTEENSQFNEQVKEDAAVGAKTMGTVPMEGWVAKSGTGCSFPASIYPNQTQFNPYDKKCGNGILPNGTNGCTKEKGCDITGNDPTLIAEPIDNAAWAEGWVRYLVGKFGDAAHGGVAVYSLDNEPAWWDGGHRDVHPKASTYDEVTDNGIATAKAIKKADPTAAVSGPVVDFWWNYFYSKAEIESGWNTAPCHQSWSNPTDRAAHGGVPFVEYYLRQFNAASTSYGARLLDYLDLHTYFAGSYDGKDVGLAPAGDTAEQKVRLNSTRAFWDPTYTDKEHPQPNYTTDPNYTATCNVPLEAPQLIERAQAWVAKDYPGTKVAFTEYNWGGLENVNGAVAQADILGIFGKYGLDLATLWGPPDPKTQAPGLMAYEIYRNYDGKNSMFGDRELDSSSADQGQLSIYGAVRSRDKALTIVVINKTYGPLTATLRLANFASKSGAAQTYLYSNANINAIEPQAAVAITPPGAGAKNSSIAGTYPAQSITLFVIPN